jgi:hypothetical protein
VTIRRPLTSIAVAAAIALGGGCAPGLDDRAEAPLPVPLEIVPAALPTGALTLHLNDDPDTNDAFKTAGPTSLVGEGKVWEIRDGARLVGAVELATLKRRVNPGVEKDRRAILGQILPGATERIDLAGQPVWTAKADGAAKAIYVFFGAHILGIVQLKGKGIQPSAISADLINRITAQPAWGALPPEAFVDSPPKDG